MASIKVLLLENDQEYGEVISFIFQDYLGFEFEIIQSTEDIGPHLEVKKNTLLLANEKLLDKSSTYLSSRYLKYLTVGEGEGNQLARYFDLSNLLLILKKIIPSFKLPAEEYCIAPAHLLKKMKSSTIQVYIEKDSKMLPITRAMLQYELDNNIHTQTGTLFYIERDSIFPLVEEFLRNLTALKAWEELDDISATRELSFKTEKIRDMAVEFGWNENIALITQKNLEKALHLSKNNPDFNKTVSHFQSVKAFTKADHNSLALMTAFNILDLTNRATEMNKITLTLATLLHDISLSDLEIQNKNQILNDIRLKGAKFSAETEKYFNHPFESSKLCRDWKFAPPLASQIILQHHEKPDGSGFPQGLRADQIEKNTAVFIIAQDFADFFAGGSENLNNPNLLQFVAEREPLYKIEPFMTPFISLKEIILKWMSRFMSTARQNIG